jgi:calcineurin-like phosphoesterase family protein
MGTARRSRPAEAGHYVRLVTIAVVVALASVARLESQISSSRVVVIISDLHLGPGRNPSGEWLPIEDFRWQQDFASFLRAIDEAGKASADLVLNGDTFELWQSLTDACRYGDRRLGCTEQEARERLDQVIAAHTTDLAALGAFARSGTNRVFLVPGDHDAALLFPALATRAVAAFNAPGRVEVAARGYWLSADGAVYAEHGHQMADDPYALAAWPQPYLRSNGRVHLERSSGERLVQALYNELETRFPILDNFAQEGAGLKYVSAADPTALPADSITPLLMFFLARPTWQQFRLELDGGDVQPPEWDLQTVRRSGATVLMESLLPDDRFRPMVDRALRDGRLSLDLSTVTDSQLNAMCDYRAALRRSRRRLERSMTQAPTIGRAPSECPRTSATTGSAFDYFWRSRDSLVGSGVERVRASLAADGRPSQSIRVVALGHTHLAAAPVPVTRGGVTPLVLNAGAWQRTATPFQIEETMQGRSWSEGDALRQLRPEDLPACYGVIWIEPYAADPRPRIRFWRGDGRWGTLPRDAAGMATACGGSGPSA